MKTFCTLYNNQFYNINIIKSTLNLQLVYLNYKIDFDYFYIIYNLYKKNFFECNFKLITNYTLKYYLNNICDYLVVPRDSSLVNLFNNNIKLDKFPNHILLNTIYYFNKINRRTWIQCCIYSIRINKSV